MLATTGACACRLISLRFRLCRARAVRGRACAGDRCRNAPRSAADAMAQAASPQAIAEYRRKLKEYQEARAAFEEEAGAYWAAISEKRQGRNAKRRERQAITLDDYVLTQPPLYSGPKRPVNPEPEEEKPPRERKPLPVVADFLKAAAEHFQFTPQRPASRGRVQARLCPRRAGRRADARAGRAGLFVRDRRQRQSRHAIRPERLAPGLARDLDRDRLQPVAHHQQRRTARRTGPRNRQGADGKGRDAVGRGAQGDGSQARGAEADGGVHAHGAGHMVGA